MEKLFYDEESISELVEQLMEGNVVHVPIALLIPVLEEIYSLFGTMIQQIGMFGEYAEVQILNL